MGKLRLIITLFLTLQLSLSFAQRGLYVGAGGGTTFYYGSITGRDIMGFSGGANASYQFNDQIGVGLAYNANTLQASRDAYGSEYHFEGTLNAVEFHLYTDLIGIIRNNSNYSPVKVKIDLGAGLINYDATAYLNGVVDRVHFDSPPSKGSSYKVHIGLELDYNITEHISTYFSILGNYCLTSDVDAYAYYTKNGVARTPTKNDFYYATTVGARYYFGSTGYSQGRKKRPSIMSSTLSFSRYSGKKTAKQSFFNNNRSSYTQSYGISRYQGKTRMKQGRKLESREARNARRQQSSYNRYYNRR